MGEGSETGGRVAGSGQEVTCVMQCDGGACAGEGSGELHEA